MLARWLHLYVSLISFGVVFFFSITGLTLNHPTWLGGSQQVTKESHGELNRDWLPADASRLSKLEIVEHLRGVDGARGAVKEFTADDFQIVIGFRAPGYSADAFIDRETAKYQLVQTSFGLIAVLNDLHKGRDSGYVWSILIDISAIVLVIVSLTGFWLLFYIRRRRMSGVVVSIIGVLVVLSIYLAFVPR